MKVELISITPNPEEVIEKCARLCYSSESKGEDARQKLIAHLAKNKHLSCFEHASATFIVSDVSRALTHQLVRHRHFSFCQRSQRYVDEEGFTWVVPQSIENNPKLVSEFQYDMRRIAEMYKKYRSDGVLKEDARAVLPNACSTQIAVTGNFRTFREFFEKRCEKHAQLEIRNLAKTMLGILYNEAQFVFKDQYEKFVEVE